MGGQVSIQPPNVAVLLAAGRGSRLRPYTDQTPKPLLPHNGKPTLDYILQAVAFADIKRVIVVTNYLAEQVAAFVGDGDRWGLRARSVYQSERLGTAHALLTAMEAVPEWFDGPLLLSATDYILPLHFFADLVSERARRGADIMVSLKQLDSAELSARSSVRYHANFVIDEIVEKPARDAAPSHFGASLIYIVPNAIRNYLQTLEPSPRGEYELPSAVNRLLSAGYRAYGLNQGAPLEWAAPAA